MVDRLMTVIFVDMLQLSALVLALECTVHLSTRTTMSALIPTRQCSTGDSMSELAVHFSRWSLASCSSSRAAATGTTLATMLRVCTESSRLTRHQAHPHSELQGLFNKTSGVQLDATIYQNSNVSFFCYEQLLSCMRFKLFVNIASGLFSQLRCDTSV